MVFNMVFLLTGKYPGSIPKGSILGPLFSIVYGNDIKTCMQHGKCLFYAAETVLYLTGELHRSTVEMQADLIMFKSWCDRNPLAMNIKKTKYVFFGLKSFYQG